MMVAEDLLVDNGCFEPSNDALFAGPSRVTFTCPEGEPDYEAVGTTVNAFYNVAANKALGGRFVMDGGEPVECKAAPYEMNDGLVTDGVEEGMVCAHGCGKGECKPEPENVSPRDVRNDCANPIGCNTAKVVADVEECTCDDGALGIQGEGGECKCHGALCMSLGARHYLTYNHPATRSAYRYDKSEGDYYLHKSDHLTVVERMRMPYGHFKASDVSGVSAVSLRGDLLCGWHVELVAQPASGGPGRTYVDGQLFDLEALATRLRRCDNVRDVTGADGFTRITFDVKDENDQALRYRYEFRLSGGSVESKLTVPIEMMHDADETPTFCSADGSLEAFENSRLDCETDPLEFSWDMNETCQERDEAHPRCGGGASCQASAIPTCPKNRLVDAVDACAALQETFECANVGRAEAVALLDDLVEACIDDVCRISETDATAVEVATPYGDVTQRVCGALYNVQAIPDVMLTKAQEVPVEAAPHVCPDPNGPDHDSSDDGLVPPTGAPTDSSDAEEPVAEAEGSPFIVKEGYDDDDDIFSQLMDHFDDIVDSLGKIDEYKSKAEDFVTDEDTKPYAITLGIAIFLCFAMMFSWLACHCFHTKKPEGGKDSGVEMLEKQANLDGDIETSDRERSLSVEKIAVDGGRTTGGSTGGRSP